MWNEQRNSFLKNSKVSVWQLSQSTSGLVKPCFSVILRWRSNSGELTFRSPHFLTIHGCRDNTTRILAQTASAFTLSQHMVLDNNILLIFVLCIKLCERLLGNSCDAGGWGSHRMLLYLHFNQRFYESIKECFLSLTKSKVSFHSTTKLTLFFSIMHTCLYKYFKHNHPSCVVTEN